MLISDSFALRIGVSRHSAFMLFVVPVLRSLFAAVLALCGASAAYMLYIIMRRRIAAYRSPLRNVPGPKNVHWFRGSFVDVREQDSTRLQEEWVRTYGHVLKFYSTLGVRLFFFSSLPSLFGVGYLFFSLKYLRMYSRLFYDAQTQILLAVDPVAISYVLQNSDTFQKSEFLRYSFDVAIGKGMHDNSFLGRARRTLTFHVPQASYLPKVRSWRLESSDALNPSYCIRVRAQEAGDLRAYMPI